jgi:ABC-type transporter Mla subunit MlaD
MASANERTRNNVRMGIFVSVALLLAMGIIFALSDVWTMLTRQTDPWAVRFTTESGVAFIKPGSEVRIGGVTLGAVARVSPVFPSTPSDAFRFVDVHFELDRKVRLYRDATVLASTQLIGAEGWLDIPNVGTPAAGEPTDEPIIGTEGLGMLTSLLGPTQATKTGDTLDNIHVVFSDVRTLGEFLRIIPDEYHSRIIPIIEDLKDTTGRARSTVVSFTDETWPNWQGQIEGAIVSMKSAADNADALTGDARGIAADLRDVVAENRPHLRSTLANAETISEQWLAISEQVRGELLSKVDALLDTGQDGLDSAAAAVNRIRTDYEGWAVVFGETLSGVNLAGQQLKLASIELRRAPWKLLHRPSKRELEHELLYESARSFALAAAELKTASQSVERVLDQFGDELAEDDEARDRLRRSLLDPIENYIKAQERLMDVLFEQ